MIFSAYKNKIYKLFFYDFVRKTYVDVYGSDTDPKTCHYRVQSTYNLVDFDQSDGIFSLYLQKNRSFDFS